MYSQSSHNLFTISSIHSLVTIDSYTYTIYTIFNFFMFFPQARATAGGEVDTQRCSRKMWVLGPMAPGQLLTIWLFGSKFTARIRRVFMIFR